MKTKISMLMIIILVIMASCQKEQTINPSVPAAQGVGTPDPGDSGNQVKSVMTESAVSPKFGKPNSTYYYFKVTDVTGTTALSVKLYEKATGTTTYLPMTKIGSYWTLSTKISINGWYDYRYVYSISKANISSNSYSLCNTNNNFATCPYLISWPFGADGSSWNNRTVVIGGVSQMWKGGQEGGSGDGWGDGYHTGTSEYYSDDWNRGTGSQDFGAEIRSPLDGYISAFGTYSTAIGSSKYVSIVQQSSNGNLYRFYVGHLNAIQSGLSIGQYVRAGVTKIGTLGMTGASSPHAHTNLRDITNGANTSVPFYFSAQ